MEDWRGLYTTTTHIQNDRSGLPSSLPLMVRERDRICFKKGNPENPDYQVINYPVVVVVSWLVCII